jgi:hypothetical protein
VVACVDDLGHEVAITEPPVRIVSLVPSLTEALAATVPDRLVGATDWCTHPVGLDVARVRGTKNPNLKAIEALGPDLVVTNREENRQLDVERMRGRGIAVWVTEIETVDSALQSMRRLFVDALQTDEPSWLVEAARVWAEPAPLAPVATMVPIWRNPWMVVGSATFTGDLLERLGLRHLFGSSEERYPTLTQEQLDGCGAELVLLPDEPYVFTESDGPDAFPDTRHVLVSGRSLTWYGPSMVTARSELTAAIGSAYPDLGLSC